MGSQKNYYSILNIPEDSSEEDIKRAYHKLVMRHHPDKNSGKKSDIFNEIQEAYDFLIAQQHPKKTARKSSTRPRKGTDISISLKINVSDIANESTKNIITSRLIHCPDCNGTGCTSKTLILCHECNGTGIDMVSAIMGPKKFCNVCKGYGNYQKNPDCKKCRGTGLITENINRQIKISRDFQNLIVIPQSGNYPIGEGIPGNLNITFLIEKTSNYEVDGRNIKGPLKISPAQAVLGDTLYIDVFGDPVKIIVPAGTRHGETLEKENAGISKGNKKGSLFLKVLLDIPKSVSDEEKKLYSQLLKLQKGYL